MSKKKIYQFEKSNISLSNPYFKFAIWDVLEAYGYPIDSNYCETKQEKIMYIYGLMAVIYALKRDFDLTTRFCEDEKFDELGFARSYFEKFGHHIIPTEEEAGDADVYALLKTGKGVEKFESNRLELSGSDEKSRNES